MRHSAWLFISLLLFTLCMSLPLSAAPGHPPDYNSDPAGYAAWKAELTRLPHSGALDALDLMMDNGWIYMNVSSSSGDFNEGGRTLGSDPVKRISYMYPTSPSTGSHHYKIDGTVYQTDASTASSSGSYADGFWVQFNSFHGVNIRQEYLIRSLGPNPGDIEQILWRSKIWSADGGCHSVGVIIQYDTMVGDNDASRVATSMGYTGQSILYGRTTTGIPPTWRSYEAGAPPTSTGLASLGILRGFEAIEPDWFYIGEWSLEAYGNAWNQGGWSTGMPYSDSAVLVKWEAVSNNVCGTDTLVRATYYGVAKTELSLRMQLQHDPPTIDNRCGAITPNPVSIDVMVTNWATDTTRNISLQLTNLTSGSTVTSGTNPYIVSWLNGFGGGTVGSWDVTLAPGAMMPPCYDIVFGYDSIWADTSTTVVRQERPASAGWTQSGGAWQTGTQGGEACWGLYGSHTGGLFGADFYLYSPTMTLPNAGPGVAGCNFLVLDVRHQWDATAGSDGGILQVSTDGGTIWTTITPTGGYYSTCGSLLLSWPCFSAYSGTTGWVHNSWDLTPYANRSVRFRFDYYAPSLAGGGDWYISRFDIFCGTAAEGVIPVSGTTHYCMNVTGSSDYRVDAYASPNPICAEGGTSSTLTGSASGSAGYPPIIYTWMPAYGLSGTVGQTVNAQPETTTTYTVIATSSNGCVAMDTVTVVVNPRPTVTATGDTVCEGQPGELWASSPTGTTFNWTGPGGSYTGNPIHPTVAGNYCVTVTDANGCISLPACADLINSTGLTADAGPDWTVCSDSNICIGTPSGAYGGIGPYTYSWNPTTGLSDPVSPAPCLRATTNTTYTLTVTDAIGCQDQDEVNIYVNEGPGAITLLSPPNGSSQTPGSVTLEWNAVTIGTPPITYDLYYDGGLLASNLTDTRYNVSVGCNQHHTWFVVVNNLCGADTSDIWAFTVPSCLGPVTYIITPTPGSITACNPHEIQVLCNDSDGIDWSTVIIQVQGSTYPYPSPRWTHRGDTLVYTQVPWFASGESVYVAILRCDDINGNPATVLVNWSFYVDYVHPVVTNGAPTVGEVVPRTDVDISLDLTDDYSGVNPESILVTVTTPRDTFSGGIHNPAVTWAPPTFTIDHAAAGLTYQDGDIVNICVHATDRADTCGPNVLDTCWSFSIAVGNPTAELNFPPVGAISACSDQSIRLLIHDSRGIDPSSILLEVEGFNYRISAPTLVWRPETLIFTPSIPWTNNQRVEYCLLEASNIINNPLLDTVCGWFIVDLQPPVVLNAFPPPGDVSNDSFRVVHAVITDSLAGIDTTSLFLEVDGHRYGPGDRGFSWRREPIPPESTHIQIVMDFDPEIAGIHWTDDDTVLWCIGSHDRPDLCAPNEMNPCRPFVVHLSGPIEVVEFPWDSAITSCADQQIRITITDPYTVNWSSIVLRVAGVDYTMDSTRQMSHVGDTLVFNPNPLWVHGQVVHVELTAAQDRLGNPLTNPLAWLFIVDLQAPVVVAHTPACGEVVATTQPTVTWRLEDLVSGVDDGMVSVRIDGHYYDADSAGFSYVAATNSVTWDAAAAGVFFTGGDVIQVCVFSQDQPDICLPNDSIPCCSLAIARGGPLATEICPVGGVYTTCVHAIQTMTVTDTFGIIPSSIVIRVNEVQHRVGDGFTTYVGDTLTFTPSPWWGDGEAVTVCADSAVDSMFNTMEYPHCWTFNMDLSAPFLWNVSPVPLDTVATIHPQVCLNVNDTLSGLNADSLRLQVGGTWYTPASPSVDWNPATHRLCWDPVAAGREFYGGDTVRVCLHAIDSPTPTSCACPPNALDTCWFFIIEPGGPIATEIRPTDSIYSACDTQAVTMFIVDDDGILPSTIVIHVNGARHVVGDGRTSYTGTTLTYVPLVPFANGEWVTVCVDSVLDSLHNPLENPHCWSFQMDLTPPILSGANPATGDTFTGTRPIVTFTLSDLITGVDTSSVEVRINGAGPWDLLSTPLYYNAATGEWTFSSALAGLRFFAGESVRVCVHAEDQPTPGYCVPNALDTCWTFFIRMGGPDGIIIFPQPGTWVACPDTVVRMWIVSDNGLDPTSVRFAVWRNTADSTVYSVDGVRLTLTDTLLRYDPDPYWVDGDSINVALIAADDTLRSHLNAIVRWSFRVDLTPPEISGIVPPPLSVEPTITPLLGFTLLDRLSGLNVDSTRIIIRTSGGFIDTLGLRESPGSWTPGTHHWGLDMGALPTTLSGGDTVFICVRAPDSPTYCAPNVLDTCWYFTIAIGGPRATIERPFEWAISACPAESVIINLDDPDGVNASTIRLVISWPHVGDSTYSVGPRLHYADPWLTFQPGPNFWVNNDTVRVRLTAAQDNLGNTLETPLDWYFVMDLQGPQVLDFYPPPDTTFLLWGDRPDITINLTDNILGVAESTIRVQVVGIFELTPMNLSLADAMCGWDAGTGTFTFHPDLVVHTNGDPQLTDGAWYPELVPITVTLTDAADRTPDYCVSNHAADTTWTFMVADDDTLPPTFTHAGPDRVTWNTPFHFFQDIWDTSGIWSTSVWLTYGTDTLTVDDPTTRTDMELQVGNRWVTLTATPINPPVNFSGWLYVRIHATDNDYDFLRAADRFPGSSLDSVLVQKGPMSIRVLPPQDAITSCPLQVIKLKLWSELAIVPGSIQLNVNGDVFTLGPNLAYTPDDSLLIFTPSVPFANEAVVTVTLIAATDVDGNPLVFGDSWSFRVDTQVPNATMWDPPGVQEQPGGAVMVTDTRPLIRIEVTDNLAGVDPSCFRLTVKGVTFQVGDIGLSWQEPYLIFNPRDRGIQYLEGDTIQVCLQTCDLPTVLGAPDYCEPNDTVYCWSFNIEPLTPCAVRPDPFSPNNDGINDFDVFNYPHMFSEKATIAIFTVRNVEVWRSNDAGPYNSFTSIEGRRFNGYDNSGILVKPGVYLYVIEVKGQVVCQGTITVAK